MGFFILTTQRSFSCDSQNRSDGTLVSIKNVVYFHFVRPALTPNSVVVADDVMEIQHLLEHWLRELGYLVTCVSSGDEAIRVFRTVHVDMVITDILMPDGDGLEVITELRALQPAARIIAMSGGGNHLRAADCSNYAMRLGAHGVLVKPFNRQQLLDAVGQQLARGTSEKPA